MLNTNRFVNYLDTMFKTRISSKEGQIEYKTHHFLLKLLLNMLATIEPFSYKCTKGCVYKGTRTKKICIT